MASCPNWPPRRSRAPRDLDAPHRAAAGRPVPLRHRHRAHGARRHRRLALGRAHAGRLAADRPAVRARDQPDRRRRAAALDPDPPASGCRHRAQRAAHRTERPARAVADPAADRPRHPGPRLRRRARSCSPSRPACTSARASGPARATA